MLKNSRGKFVNPDTLSTIQAGGEGAIYELSPTEVLKVYFTPRPKSFDNHLKSLSTLSSTFVCPKEVWYTSSDQVAGFSMTYIDLNKYKIFSDLFNKGFCSTHKLDLNFKLGVLEKLKEAVLELHSKGIVVGDLNQYNLFFNLKGELLIIDVDSFQTSSNPHSGVVLDDVRDWNNPISTLSDYWAYDVLAFWAATFCHPFRWVVKGNTDSLQTRVKSGKCVLSSIPNVIIPAVYSPLDTTANEEFREVFERHQRFLVTIGQSHAPITLQPTQTLSGNVSTLFVELGVTDLYCTETQLCVRSQDSWKLYSVNMHRTCVLKETLEASHIAVYPGIKHFAYLTKDYKLVASSNGWSMQFHDNCLFQFNASGSLSVIDPHQSLQYFFDISSQYSIMGYTTQVVFYKGILQRSAFIQNFGAKTYINTSKGSFPILLPVKQGVKDAYTVDNYVAVERKRGAKVVYEIYDGHSEPLYTLDAFPYFAVKNGLIFIAKQDCIEVYSKSNLVSRITLSPCTEDSKLYSCNAGILIWDSGNVHLLNTT